MQTMPDSSDPEELTNKRKLLKEKMRTRRKAMRNPVLNSTPDLASTILAFGGDNFDILKEVMEQKNPKKTLRNIERQLCETSDEEVPP